MLAGPAEEGFERDPLSGPFTAADTCFERKMNRKSSHEGQKTKA